ncbi:MAG: [FeFe] hydrogenase H-cluster radical SAM maturase HydE [Eubacteriales bacterium]|nr:[FeFe] hydrogenase H-cluster radical SAM maturase HydE [Eubacteriales bacterium]
MSQRSIQQIRQARDFNDDQLMEILTSKDEAVSVALRERAQEVLLAGYGRAVYVRGLIEFSNVCRQDCYYCGIRASNSAISRFRLSPEEIIQTALYAYKLGFQTLVLQGGEDPWFTEERLVGIVRAIKKRLPKSRLTLSIGIRPEEELAAFREAGADRFLLRHETANEQLFSALHPPQQSFAQRRSQLYSLKKLGYTVGAGFLVGAPGSQPTDHLTDIRFLRELQPQMIGIGPFIPQQDTPLRAEAAGDLTLTLKLLAVLRIIFPQALLPATTALQTIDPRGRLLGLQYGANVVMPNVSPQYARERYQLYDHKAASGLEAGEHLKELSEQLNSIGRYIEVGAGDPILS